MRLLCRAHCSKTEYDSIKEKLEEIPEIQLTTFGTTITAVYEPDDNIPVVTMNEIASRIAEIIEPVEEHGISLITKVR